MRSPASLQPQCHLQGNHDDGHDFTYDQNWNMQRTIVLPIKNVKGLKWWPVYNADRFAGITIHLLTLSLSRRDRYPWLRWCVASISELLFREHLNNIYIFAFSYIIFWWLFWLKCLQSTAAVFSMFSELGMIQRWRIDKHSLGRFLLMVRTI